MSTAGETVIVFFIATIAMHMFYVVKYLRMIASKP